MEIRKSKKNVIKLNIYLNNARKKLHDMLHFGLFQLHSLSAAVSVAVSVTLLLCQPNKHDVSELLEMLFIWHYVFFRFE